MTLISKKNGFYKLEIEKKVLRPDEIDPQLVVLRTPLQLRTFISDSTELKHFLIMNFELTLYLI